MKTLKQYIREGRGKYTGSHFEITYKQPNGEESFTVVLAKSKDEAKTIFKTRHKDYKIKSIRGTGHDIYE